jgi:hypothetical protein
MLNHRYQLAGRLLRSGALIAALVVSATSAKEAVGSTSPLAAKKAEGSTSSLAAGLMTTCKGCTECSGGEEHHRTLDSGAGFEVYGSGHSWCLLYSCGSEHSLCGDSRRDGERAVYVLNEKLSKASGADIEEYVASLGKLASINYERRAVQIFGCEGDVVAHIPPAFFKGLV